MILPHNLSNFGIILFYIFYLDLSIGKMGFRNLTNQLAHSIIIVRQCYRMCFSKNAQILKEKIYGSIPRMIFALRNYQDRKVLYDKLKKEIAPLKLPKTLDLALQLLVVIKNNFLLKFILYKLKPRYIESYDDPSLRISEYK